MSVWTNSYNSTITYNAEFEIGKTRDHSRVCVYMSLCEKPNPRKLKVFRGTEETNEYITVKDPIENFCIYWRKKYRGNTLYSGNGIDLFQEITEFYNLKLYWDLRNIENRYHNNNMHGGTRNQLSVIGNRWLSYIQQQEELNRRGLLFDTFTGEGARGWYDNYRYRYGSDTLIMPIPNADLMHIKNIIMSAR